MAHAIVENEATMHRLFYETLLEGNITALHDEHLGNQIIGKTALDHLIESHFVYDVTAKALWMVGGAMREVTFSHTTDTVRLSTAMMEELGIGIGDTIQLTDMFNYSYLIPQHWNSETQSMQAAETHTFTLPLTYTHIVGGVSEDFDILLPFGAAYVPESAIRSHVQWIQAGMQLRRTASVWSVNGGTEISLDFAPGANQVVVGGRLAERLGITWGDTVTLSYGNFHTEVQIVIQPELTRAMIAEWGWVTQESQIQQFLQQNQVHLDMFMLPLYVRDAFGNERFHAATFVVDPAYNRALDEFRREISPYMIRNQVNQTVISLQAEIFAESFILVLEATEQALALLGVLYPVFVILSALIAVGLAVLMTIQNIKVTATLRVLGATKPRVLAILCGEQIALCAVGLLIGAAALAALFGFDAIVPQLLGLYLGGTLLGAAGTAIPIATRIPLELLQVKE
jgi:hypothetical protein